MRGGALDERLHRLGDDGVERFGGDLVGLRQHDLVDHRALVEHVHDGLVVGFDAMARIDEQEYARKSGAAAQIVAHQFRPALDLGLRRLGVAVARHVDEAHTVAEQEEVELARAAGLARGPRQRLPARERVDEARLADVGAARERNLRAVGGRQPVHLHHAAFKRHRACKQQPACFERVGVRRCRHPTTGDEGGFLKIFASHLSRPVSTP